MLSRVADSIYWTARYLERAANMVRFLEVSYMLDLDLPDGEQSPWEPLVWITGDIQRFQNRYGEATRENVMRFLVTDPDYHNSVVSCLELARTNVKGLREMTPLSLWEEINNLGRIFEGLDSVEGFSHKQTMQLCREVNRLHMLILGMVGETMARSEGYHLWQMGTYMERADKTSRMLHVKYFHLLPHLSQVGTIVDDARWCALLQSLDARADYHRLHGVIIPEKVIDVVVRNPLFARSIRFCLEEVCCGLRKMPGASRGRPLGMLRELCEKIDRISASEIIQFGVHEFINELQIEMNRVDAAVVDALFAPNQFVEPVPFVQEKSQ